MVDGARPSGRASWAGTGIFGFSAPSRARPRRGLSTPSRDVSHRRQVPVGVRSMRAQIGSHYPRRRDSNPFRVAAPVRVGLSSVGNDGPRADANEGFKMQLNQFLAYNQLMLN